MLCNYCPPSGLESKPGMYFLAKFSCCATTTVLITLEKGHPRDLSDRTTGILQALTQRFESVSNQPKLRRRDETCYEDSNYKPIIGIELSSCQQVRLSVTSSTSPAVN